MYIGKKRERKKKEERKKRGEKEDHYKQLCAHEKSNTVVRCTAPLTVSCESFIKNRTNFILFICRSVFLYFFNLRLGSVKITRRILPDTALTDIDTCFCRPYEFAATTSASAEGSLGSLGWSSRRVANEKSPQVC